MTSLVAVVVALSGFWFNAVSSLPFKFTAEWHDRVENGIKTGYRAAADVEVLKANQSAILRNQDEQAKDVRQIREDMGKVRELITSYMQRDAERHRQ